jgi:hypothetical protein
MVSALERNDSAAVRGMWAKPIVGWSMEDWMRDGWLAPLARIAGADRRVADAWRVHEQMVRCRLVGELGEAYATVLIDRDLHVFGLAVDAELRDGDFGICVGCRPGEDDILSEFYDRLVGGRISVGDGGDEPPRWPDPDYPAQMHFDVFVADLDVGEAEVIELGATKLHDAGHFRVFADLAQHPFCLYVAPDGLVPDEGRIGILGRVVIDCPDVAALASFWSQLLPFPEYVEVTTDRVVIGREDGSLPMLAFQRVEEYHAPTWPAAGYPEQIHFDIGFDDRPAMERKALELGAVKLPPQGGSCPVYADPAGHPFCLCMRGE